MARLREYLGTQLKPRRFPPLRSERSRPLRSWRRFPRRPERESTSSTQWGRGRSGFPCTGYRWRSRRERGEDERGWRVSTDAIGGAAGGLYDRLHHLERDGLRDNRQATHGVVSPSGLTQRTSVRSV